MTSRVTEQKVRIRRSAADRRAEIVAAAIRIALSEGLDQVTLRRVADDLGVTGSLVSHYFPAVDDLLAEAFSGAAEAELEETFAALAPEPVAALRGYLAALVDQARDGMNTLWVDAWHASRRRPALNEAVRRLTAAWNGRLAGLLARGAADGDFDCPDPRVSAARIMAVVDGLTVHTVMRETLDYSSVEELVFLVTESELGLARGTLG
ncbi:MULTISPECIES: TetR/AcrR family transcriptional regulator [unclassified Nocardioides]|uniref:TetR/AcrR family transcriptional regulator n=1 Tax=unclassified Nocardioides TaxID=2615069 RepID=UPI00138F7FFA|nr:MULTISPECIES: TetR family transcriptional regulator C-terminal domain-containing protein [unclassified Nocardioides]